MKKLAHIFLLVAGLCLLGSSPASAAVTPTTPIKALILYDAPPNNEYTKLGLSYAIMLRNLLGHWNSTVDLVPVQNYTAGRVENYNVTFYLGSYYDNQIPAAFLNDASTTTNTVVWFKYNLWQLAWNPAYNFAKFGFNFTGLQGLNATPTSTNPEPGFYDTISYKNMSMTKYYAYNAPAGIVNADPDVGLTQIIDPTKATALVSMTNKVTGDQKPYIVRSGNFWYFADLPLSYIGPRDRYLVLCDILHDIVGDNHSVSRQALVRLEDVGADVDENAMKTLSTYLSNKKIPFSVAVIARYMDPLGYYNGGISRDIPLSQAATLKRVLLNQVLAKGGKLVMHGYTHQYNNVINADNAVSGNDFEFWNAVKNTPVSEDSVQWALDRINAGLEEYSSNGFAKPFAWEAPHYQSSPAGIQAAMQKFTTVYGRVVYYTSDTPNLAPGANKDFAVGQFFPYTIQKDFYGQRVLPENLGNIEYDISQIDPFSTLVYSWKDLYLNAQYALVIRDGFASFFFHPFWLEKDLGTPGEADFKSLVDGITKLGYKWVDASTLP